MLWCTKLREKFSTLFEDIPYIECSSGWEALIESLCLDIIRYESFLKDNPDYVPLTFSQVKEKFGTLRVYFDGGYIAHKPPIELLRNVVLAYEDKSRIICCGCGVKLSNIPKTPNNVFRWGAKRCEVCWSMCNE